ncbi:MAG: creatininase family protein [Betaproteobacteria bacterium]
MWLETSTSEQIRRYLERSRTIVLPMGSTEQHGPIGLIGTDSICARAVAQGLAERSEVLIAPAITLTVAQFNMGFPGTIAVRAATLLALLNDVLHALADQGFDRIYVLNGHGANIAVARAAFQDFYLERQRRLPGVPSARCRLRSWWEFAEVNALRSAWYGEFEGLHATPSEIAITMAAEPQACERARAEGAERAIAAPAALSPEFLRDHGGDNHFDALTHRAAFPDGRVGSHSWLAQADPGERLLAAAIAGAANDLEAFVAEP